MKINSKIIFVIVIFMAGVLLLGIYIGRLTSENTVDVSKIPENTETVPEETQPSLIDLNTATVQELSQIPGLSHQLAAEIIAYREEYGKYVDVDELLEIDDMTKAIYNQIINYVTVED